MSGGGASAASLKSSARRIWSVPPRFDARCDGFHLCSALLCYEEGAKVDGGRRRSVCALERWEREGRRGRQGAELLRRRTGSPYAELPRRRSVRWAAPPGPPFSALPSLWCRRRLKMSLTYGSHTSVTEEGRKGWGWRRERGPARSFYIGLLIRFELDNSSGMPHDQKW
jgi:hypothetical protein